jgi:uncharacterized membrane protein YhaH (DUF805 family)
LIRSAVLVIGLCAAYIILPLRGARWWIGAIVGLSAIFGTMPITVRRLHAVRRSETPVLVALEAIVLLVTMLVLGFASVYYAINVNQTQFNQLDTRLDAVYFTVVTLSTVGYGDIVATGEVARFTVILQILLNLTFVGVVVRVMARAAGADR